MAKSKKASQKPPRKQPESKAAASNPQRTDAQESKVPSEKPAPPPASSSSSSSSSSQDQAVDFESWYLQQVTREFADDLDRIRGAGDFNERSVPVLVEALRRGASLCDQGGLGGEVNGR